MNLIVILSDRPETGDRLSRLLNEEHYQTVLVYEACDALCAVWSVRPEALVVELNRRARFPNESRLRRFTPDALKDASGVNGRIREDRHCSVSRGVRRP